MQAGTGISGAMQGLTGQLLRMQREDGTWRLCFENGLLTDAYMIITLRVLQMPDEPLIRALHDRILQAQQADGSWKVYYDEKDGNVSATVEAYYALLYSGYSRPDEPPLLKAKRFIVAKGGLGSVTQVLTKIILAATGQYPWPSSIFIPLELLLLPPSSPINFFDFSGYARVHLAPMLLLADRKFVTDAGSAPDLSALQLGRPDGQTDGWVPNTRSWQSFLERIHSSLKKLTGLPDQLHRTATLQAEQYMLQRIEPDGTLYSYATSTFLMLFALLALGYDKKHPVLVRAVQGLKGMLCRADGRVFLQNSPSTVWDTALLAHALESTGLAAAQPAVRRAASYLLSKQQRSLGDWSVHNPNPVPGGWGFSESNTINPDVDDTTAALRAIKPFLRADPAYREAWNRGLNWVLSMQNSDGGWPSFERDADLPILTWLPIEGAKAAAVDPSTADLTGRTLEYLGESAGFTVQHAFIRRAVDWLYHNQVEDGSWYGRWGVCYLYGTWGALTGMRAVGVDAAQPAVQKAVHWLFRVQNEDGGWGESCESDRRMRYIPLGESTPSQTAWALDALISVHAAPTPQMEKGAARLVSLLQEQDWRQVYPTGAGLPGFFYSHYHSYRYIWPLLALSHYRRKYGSAAGSALD